MIRCKKWLEICSGGDHSDTVTQDKLHDGELCTRNHNSKVVSALRGQEGKT